MNLSVALVLEHQDVCRRLAGMAGLTTDDVDAAIDYLCTVGTERQAYYLWRPCLRNPNDEMVLELAIVAAADIVTYNVADFLGADTFGVRVLTPRAFLRELEQES